MFLSVSHKQINNIIANLQSPKKANGAVNSIIENSHVNETNDPNLNQPIQVDAMPPVDVEPRAFPSQVYVDAIPTVDTNIYREMIPYNTTDPNKISQQEAILELLISNDICNDETFKIFIAEPDLHKDKASAILDDLYCVSKLLPDDDMASVSDWQSVAGDAPLQTFAFIPMESAVSQMTDVQMAPATQISTMTSTPVFGEPRLKFPLNCSIHV